jgi:hypothetical protein
MELSIEMRLFKLWWMFLASEVKNSNLENYLRPNGKLFENSGRFECRLADY